MEKRFSHHLRDEYRYDENGKYVHNYRLRVQNPHNIEMGLAYDIKCPHVTAYRDERLVFTFRNGQEITEIL